MRNGIGEMEWVFPKEKIATPCCLILGKQSLWMWPKSRPDRIWVCYLSWELTGNGLLCMHGAQCWHYVVQMLLFGTSGFWNPADSALCMTCQRWDYGASQVCPGSAAWVSSPFEFIRWVSGKKITPFLISVVLISDSTWGIGHIFLDRTCNRPWRKMMSPQLIIMGLGSPKEETRWDCLSLNYVISRN